MKISGLYHQKQKKYNLTKLQTKYLIRTKFRFTRKSTNHTKYCRCQAFREKDKPKR